MEEKETLVLFRLTRDSLNQNDRVIIDQDCQVGVMINNVYIGSIHSSTLIEYLKNHFDNL